MIQTIAVDWSGRERGAEEAIWLARVRDGRLVELENGRSRDAVIGALVAAAEREPRTVAGLDFAFAFPAWYAESRGWTGGRAIWDAMRDEADDLLERCEPPFWGRPGRPAQTLGPALRETEATAARTPKSVFQIGGAGAVGTGSLRGMGHLAQLADAGIAIWPFDDPRLPMVVEIYPRVLTEAASATGEPVVKRRHRVRRDFLARHFGEQDPVLRERAAGSEDAFDAAVSALVMARHAGELAALPAAPPTSRARIEGAIWAPGGGLDTRRREVPQPPGWKHPVDAQRVGRVVEDDLRRVALHDEHGDDVRLGLGTVEQGTELVGVERDRVPLTDRQRVREGDAGRAALEGGRGVADELHRVAGHGQRLDLRRGAPALERRAVGHGRPPTAMSSIHQPGSSTLLSVR